MPSPPEPAGAGASRRIPGVEVIRAKRDGSALTSEQIDAVVTGYARGEVAEEQMTALAMAVLLRGMDVEETARWTAAMVASDEVLDLGGLGRPAVDRHSTGGVGDKTTLVLTCSRRCWPPAARSFRSCPGAGSGAPAGPWTSWRRSRGGARSWARTRFGASSARSVRSWPRPLTT